MLFLYSLIALSRKVIADRRASFSLTRASCAHSNGNMNCVLRNEAGLNEAKEALGDNERDELTTGSW